MAKRDTKNRSSMWSAPGVDGLMMMRAEFSTHEFAPHFHDELVIAITEAGGSEYKSRGVHERAEPETVLAFNPNEPHSSRLGRSDLWRYRAFYFGDCVLRQFAEDLSLSPDARTRFTANKLNDPVLSRRFLTVHEKMERSAGALEAQTELISAVASLYLNHGCPALKPPTLGNEKTAVSKVRQFLMENLDHNVSIRELAQLAGMSTFHLIRSFKKETGLPPHAYLTHLRVRKARTLLERRTALAKVAADVGFFDQPALCRHFKRIYGVTPKQYVSATAD